MKRILLAMAVLLGALAPAHAAQFKFSNQTLTVPDGFTVELVAQSPLVERPITGDLDEQGRLYLTDSSGMTEKADRQLQDKPHRVVRLEDTDGDGVFDKTVVFADKMMFPEGSLWYDGSLYVAAPPSIWKLTDADGDGVAEKRVEWFQGKTLTGCANDLHGPYLGPDGWIYWCKGAFAKQTYERPGKKPFETRAAHIFRCRPDGTGIEPVMTGGMDNPVDVTFTPEGERIFTTTFFQHPGGGQRDGLIHAIYGGLYGKPHDVLDDHKHTGDLMPVLTHMGPAAPCGLTRYESKVFGIEYQDNLFSCQFNLHKVQRHILDAAGGTFKTRDVDFLVSDNPDFHPTDVIEDADGSLLVIDTGGWYRICCPTSQIAKPDVLGAVYRVRRKDAPKIEDPRGLKLDWKKMKAAELANLLGDERVVVQHRAIAQLGKLGGSAVSALSKTLKSESTLARRNAVWALTRIETSSARAAVRTALGDKQETVQQTAIHSVSLLRDTGAVAKLMELLKSSNPHVQRVAAEALGRIGSPAAVPALLEASAKPQERVMDHAFIYALIEINNPKATAAGLTAASSTTRGAAMIALDQMDDGWLEYTDVTPLLTSSDATLRGTATWIAGLHPEWGEHLYSYFSQRLKSSDLTEAERDELQHQLAAFGRNPLIQRLYSAVLGNAAYPPAAHEMVLRAMAQSSLKEMPKVWLGEVRHSLTMRNEGVVRAALATLRAVPVGKTNAADFFDPIMRITRDPSRPGDLRLEALAALPANMAKVDADIFKFLTNSLAPTNAPLERSAAAGVLGRAKLNEEQLVSLTETLPAAGPLEVSKLLTAFDAVPNEAVGLKLVEALKDSKGLAVLRPDALKQRLAKFPASVRTAGQGLIDQLNVDGAKQKAQLDELMVGIGGGDKNRGHIIFNNPKVACSTCHSIGYLGGKVGPDLTRVGGVRTERDLLESIVYPSASFVRNFEPMIIITKDGEEHSGVIRSETTDSVVLVSGLAVEQRIARSTITEMRPGTVSVMPDGLSQQLTKQELADLIAFLRSLK